VSAFQRWTCVDCGAVSPDGGDREPISTPLGWAPWRRLDVNGETHHDWRCPSCGDKHRKHRAAAGLSSGSFPAVGPASDRRKENK
jgi:hypothetical protein